jgi:hypothetical protein
MAVQLASNLAPKNNQAFYLLEDVYIKGGLMIQPTLAARNSIPFANLKIGQLVIILDDGKCWQVKELSGPSLENPTAPQNVVWEEFKFGNGDVEPGTMKARQVAIKVIDSLPPETSADFHLNLGISAIILRLEVDRPVRVQAYATAAMDEPNPYHFLATEDHLFDDGSTLLSDGTVLKSRQYSIWANMESPTVNRMYMKVTSSDATDGPVTLTITYLTLEDGPVPLEDLPPEE